MSVASASSISKTLGQILPDAVLPKNQAQIIINNMTLDSREVGEGDLFVAVQGLQTHGKCYIPQAQDKGAIAVLIDAEEAEEIIADADVAIIPVKQLANQLSRIAGHFYGEPTQHMTMVAVTGTNGKTTCTQLLAQALAKLGKPAGVLGTIGYGLFKQDGSDNEMVDVGMTDTSVTDASMTDTSMTTPDPIATQAICAELQHDGAQFIAMEVSSHALLQDRVAGLDIDTAVFTNLSHDHLDYHGTMKAYAEAKARLFAMPSLNYAIINQDDEHAELMLASLPEACQLISFSLDQTQSAYQNAHAHFALTQITLGNDGMQAVLLTPEGEFSVATRLLGRFNLSNLLAVIATLYAHQFLLQDIVSVIPELRPVKGRMEIIPNTLGFQVVVDYAHTPDALKNALAALAPHTKGKLCCVFGCGGDRDREKRPKMARIAECYADKIVVTTDNPRKENSMQIFADIEAGFHVPREVVADRSTAIEYAIFEAKAEDVILIAGKGHEEYQWIGDKYFPFSDQRQAHFYLQQREAEETADA